MVVSPLATPLVVIGVVRGLVVCGHAGTSGGICEVFVLHVFPISAINFQCKASKLGEVFEAREMKETVLDMFGQSFVCCMSEGSIIPLSASGSSSKVYEVACSLMVLLHDYLLEFDFCLHSIVEGSEVHFEL